MKQIQAVSGNYIYIYIYIHIVDLLPVSGINEVLNCSQRGTNRSIDERKFQFLNADCRGSEEDFYLVKYGFDDCSDT
jgi:hypothetical protein